MLTVFDAVTTHRVCPCDCFRNLTLAERIAGVRAVYHLDDALRGWGYTPIYDVHGDLLFKQAQQKGDASYRGVAVRFGECIYRRLLGSLVHECLHAICGDVTKANYGILFGLPYGVPVDVPPSEEEAFLEPFNFGEARAWAGVWLVGKKMFGIDWNLRTARDIGTYCFVGGNALVAVPAGYRAVAHVDRMHHPGALLRQGPQAGGARAGVVRGGRQPRNGHRTDRRGGRDRQQEAPAQVPRGRGDREERAEEDRAQRPMRLRQHEEVQGLLRGARDARVLPPVELALRHARQRLDGSLGCFAEPEVFGKKTDLGGIALVPAGGLMLRLGCEARSRRIVRARRVEVG